MASIYLLIFSRRALHSDLFIMNMFDLQRELGINPKGGIIEVTESLAFLDKDSRPKEIYID
jgi:hypothetical protein